jgi:ubiquinone/menaquinone biosynthesis C-methylase UbiE
MGDFKNKARGFEDPIALPRDQTERDRWLESNRQWWENQPMRYDFSTELNTQKEHSVAWFREIDERFFGSASQFLPWKDRPFDQLISFRELHNQRVLEIGVGNGSHAQLLASFAKEFHGIDLTEYAVRSTTARLELFGVRNAFIRQMNAETLEYPDSYFDYIWSWGVIHHTADTNAVLREMYRVLAPGGRATVMVYYRSFWYTYVIAGLMHGVFRGYWLSERSLHAIVQRTMDGAIARFYKIPEWQRAVEQAGFQLRSHRVVGQKTDLVLLPGGKIKDAVLRVIPDSIARFFTNSCRMGYFLVTELVKPAHL